MQEIDVPVASLLLDASNPRHRRVEGQADAIAAMEERQPQKLLALAEDICAHGLSPIDRVLVMPHSSGRGYVVLEGNRRMAALKLIANPDLCSVRKFRDRYKALRDGGTIPDQIRCVVVNTRSEAHQWLLLKHGGELDGAGTVRWSTGMRQRFDAKPGTQEYRALAVLDWLEKIGVEGANQSLLRAVEYTFDDKITTFGRLVTDPDFRSAVGFELDDKEVKLTEEKFTVVDRLADVMRDLEGGLTVTDLRAKEQRNNYVKKIRARWLEDSPSDDTNDAGKPSGDEPTKRGDPSHVPNADDDADITSSGGSGGPRSGGGGQKGGSGGPQRNPRPRPTKLYHGLKLPSCRPKTRDMLAEAQRLDLATFPNSAAVLTRSLVELVVGEAIHRCGWQDSRELKDRIITCVDQLDPTGVETRYKAVRNQVRDRNSILGANTLNAYVHNPHFFPSPTELRDTSSNYVPLLEGLHEAIKNSGN